MQTEQNQALNDKEVVIIPHLEENISLPRNARDALPELSNEEELEMIANTIKLMSDLTGKPIQTTKEDIAEAKTVAETMIKHPETKIQLKKYKNSMLASLAGMVAELDAHVVDDLKDLKTFVVNGLIKEAATAEKSKERITALRAIGEVDGVDAFKKTTEVIHKNMSLDDIEDKLRTLVSRIEKRIQEKEHNVIDADYTISKKEIDGLQKEVKEYVGEYKLNE
jgi:hypothetical protein